MKKEEFYLNSASSGRRIHTVVWQPDGEPSAVLQLVHGMAEYIERYDAFARWLCEQGIAAIGHDHLGHGKSVESDADLGFFAENDASEIVIRDMRTVTLEAKNRFPGLPVFILGHSMGSFFVRRYLALYGGEVSGAVIMGTGWVQPSVANLGKAMAGMICKTKGERTVSPMLESMVLGGAAKAFKDEGQLGWLSVNKENVAKYEADPLCGFSFTAGAYRDFMRVMASIAKEEGYDNIRKNLPILVISGENDPIGGKAAVEKVAAQYRGLDFTDVTAKVVDGDRHEILNEDDREEVYAYIYDWMEQRIRK